MQHIRNFSIIAHIDHGKSTLADRLIQRCGGLSDREMEAQVLDSMDLERERGITIKAQTAALEYVAADGTKYNLNLIDTPGHVDFTYEVSRSLSACEGALLVVDASQGVEAQTVANCYTAIELGVEVLPILNKMDLASANADEARAEIEDVIGLDAHDAVLASAKTGMGLEEILERIIERVPPPKGDTDAALQALIIDSWFDNYVGVVMLVRVVNGVIKPKDKILLMASGATHLVEQVGVFTPKPKDVAELGPGEFVVRSREMIHPDVFVPVAAEEVDRLPQQREFQRGSRKISFLDQFLVGFQPGNVRIIENGDTFRLQRDDASHCCGKSLKRLERKPVNEIEIDARKTALPGPLIDLRGHRLRLDPVHRLLYFRIEVLHPHAHPVESGVTQRFDMFAAELPGIDFHADLRVGRHPEG